MPNIDYTLPILDIVALILSLASLIISLAIAYGIIGSKQATEKVHDKLSDIHDHLTSNDNQSRSITFDDLKHLLSQVCKNNF
jgi:hypothetical protein